MEPSDPIFKLYHRYNKLVRRGLASPLLCKSCETPVITGLGENDALVLKCLMCKSVVMPGIGSIQDVRAVVTEFFLDD